MQFGRVAVAVPALLVAVGMEHGDEIEQFAGAQRIVHQMHLLAGPHHHVAPAELLRHFRGRQHGAIGDVAGDDRLAVADDHLPDGRPQPVGADQRRAAIVFAAFGVHGDAVGRFVDLDDFLRGVEADQIGFPAGVQQHLMQIGAMDERIGMIEFLAESLAERDARDLLAGDRIHHDQVVGKDGELADRLGQAERLEHPEHVGPSWMPAPISLNSGACSISCEAIPLRASASAAASPPMPPPTMRTCWSFQLFISHFADESGHSPIAVKSDEVDDEARHPSPLTPTLSPAGRGRSWREVSARSVRAPSTPRVTSPARQHALLSDNL